MFNHRLRSFIACAALLLCSIGANAAPFPLEPPDTSSPRATMSSFLKQTDALSEAMKIDDQNAIRFAWDMAARCFDLSEVPPTIVNDVALESVLRLREILDRMELPTMESIPGREEVRNGIAYWEIPHTEIAITKIPVDGSHSNYLFSAKTVDMLDEYFEAVRQLPYLTGGTEGIYEKYIYSTGWMIPDGMIDRLPDWMQEEHAGQATWKLMGLGAIICLAAALFWPFTAWHRFWSRYHTPSRWHVSRIVAPALGITLCLFIEYLFRAQLNLTGQILSYCSMALEVLALGFASWGILILSDIVMRAIIDLRNLQKDGLDADVIRLVCRLVSLALVAALIYRAGSYFGLPVTAVFASAGIAGIAVALAARETLANFFGGISIFMDRPFRTGDYIVLDSGERGEVQTVGMRSTRLLTRDQVLITIPNSVITNLKIVNQSAPHPNHRIRIKIGVSFESDLDKVETTLMQIARDNPLALDTPPPRVGLDDIGEYAIHYTLLVHVDHPQNRGRLTRELNREIISRFREGEIDIPYPRQVVYLQRDADERAHTDLDSDAR